jgi:hypothetical protein
VTIVIISPLNSQKFPLSKVIYLTENQKPGSKGQTKTEKLRDPTEFHMGNSGDLPFTTMARPRLYNTPDEKKAARAATSKRSYQKFVFNCVLRGKLLKIIADTEIILMSNGLVIIVPRNSLVKPRKST